MLYKCNLCNPPEGDRFLVVMNNVPLRVMHTKSHADSLKEKLRKSNFARELRTTATNDRVPYSYDWDYDVIPVQSEKEEK